MYKKKLQNELAVGKKNMQKQTKYPNPHQQLLVRLYYEHAHDGV